VNFVGIAPVTRVPEPAAEVIYAAGGLVLRRDPNGGLLIAVVHRPDRADWSLPKGKLEPGESFEEAALREVHEETGYRCRLGSFIGHTEYQDRKDRHKVVAYFEMEAMSGIFRPSEEVDDLRWLTRPEARLLLSYERDRELLSVMSMVDEGGYTSRAS
jgi:8-oxo-dGTP diphosphatase